MGPLFEPHGYLMVPYVLANMTIVGGYFAAGGILLVTRYRPQFWLTLYAGALFFVTCGLHHAENALHLALEPEETVEHVSLAWHMLIIDGVQAVAIWLFMYGVFRELRYLMDRPNQP